MMIPTFLHSKKVKKWVSLILLTRQCHSTKQFIFKKTPKTVVSISSQQQSPQKIHGVHQFSINFFPSKCFPWIFNGPKETPNLSIPNSIKMVPIQIAQSLSIKLNEVVDLIGQDQQAMSSCHLRQGFDLLRRARASWAMRFLTAGGRR